MAVIALRDGRKRRRTSPDYLKLWNASFGKTLCGNVLDVMTKLP